MRQAQRGDLDAYDALVLKHQPVMTAILHRFANTRPDLEDMVQDTFVRAWRALPQWHPEKPFLHWLKRIAVNVGREFCHRRERTPFARLADPEQHPLEELADTGDAASEASLHAAEEAQFLLAKLPPDDRALLTLVYLNEMELAEIADHFGWSRTNTKIKVFRARQRLKTIVQKHGYTF